MRRLHKQTASAIALMSCAMLAYGGPVQAQGEDDTQVEQIIVTARKRQETDISVPVSITALGEAQITRQAIFSAYDLSQRIPTLTANNTGSGVGGTIFLRGVGSAVTSGNSIDQSVAFDLDGVPMSRGNMLRLGQYDLAQIQVLKGPQSLFFGKNSSAGVIAFTSIDPTNEFESVFRLAYEPYADLKYAEGIVSGPLSDTVRGRLFVRATETEGEKKNLAALALPANNIVPNVVFAPRDRAFAFEEAFVRGTLLWDPSDRLSVRLKGSYDDFKGDPPAATRERYYCPRGTPQNLTPAASFGVTGAQLTALANALSVDDCRANGVLYVGGTNPAFLTRKPEVMKSWDHWGATQSQIGLYSAEVNYDINEWLSLSSVTGYARLSEYSLQNSHFSLAAVAALALVTKVKHRQVTEELRLQTDLDGPLNFMVGGFYQDALLSTYIVNIAQPPHNVGEYQISNEVLSGFGQVIWSITDQLELAAGARYTNEEKSLVFLRDFVPQPIANPDVTFKNTSPEVTLTWRPSPDLTAYGAYKSGFKSGGYASTIIQNFAPLPTSPLRDLSYKPEDAEGFEVGLKAQLFNRSLRLDTTLYRYQYKELQVSNTDTSTGIAILRLTNAASATQEGIEVEGTYYPPAVNGLRITGNINYNLARYDEFISPCFIGQAIAEGCAINPLAGRFQQQSLAGRTMPNAPMWVGALGFTYGRDMGGFRVEVGADATYKSSWNVTQDLSPGGVQKEVTYFNAQLRFIDARDRWEFGIYAKNIGDEYRATETSNLPLTGTSANTGTVNGGVLSRADLAGNTNPGRTILFQLVLRPSAM